MRTQWLLKTTDGTFHPWDGQSQYAKNKIADLQAEISNIDRKLARKLLKVYTSITTSDGTVFTGEHAEATDPYPAAYDHEQNGEKRKDAKAIADVLYPGDMTKEEYVEHLLKNYNKLEYIFDTRYYKGHNMRGY